MSLTHLPATHLPASRLPASHLQATPMPSGPIVHGAVPAEIRNDPSAAHPEHAASNLSDELVDLYALVVIAVPLAMFLKWLWP